MPGAGVAGAGDAEGGRDGVAGAEAGALAGAWSTTELLGAAERITRARDVNMNAMAEIVVSLPRKEVVPRAPKAVCEDPPKAAATSAPFPVCRSTTMMRNTQTMMCISVRSMVIRSFPVKIAI